MNDYAINKNARRPSVIESLRAFVWSDVRLPAAEEDAEIVAAAWVRL